jgi:FdhD protein
VSATDRRPVRRWPEGDTVDRLAVESPLEIRVEDRSVAVLMRTPGDDLDLAAGFLFSEGVIDGSDDLSALAHLAGDREGNTVVARLAAGVEAHLQALEQATRERYASSACSVCSKASIERVRLSAPPVHPLTVADDVLLGLPAVLRSHQSGFRSTGGLHAAALVDAEGRVAVVREDVGRHNAVDKVLGAALRDDALPLTHQLLLVSSRAGFEIVQKALVAGVGAVATVGAATTLAVDLAADAGLPLVGFLRDDRFTRYVW